MASGNLFPTRAPGGDGILPSQEIRSLIETGIISSTHEIGDEQIQPSSVDLRLSNEAYLVQASLLAGRSTTLINKAKSTGMFKEKLDISGPTRLERGSVYIIPLMENLNLPSDVYGIANPKSTTGRLDIFTRLITETGDEFERVRKGYAGRLYLEVVSQTFPIIVQAGMRLNQLRLVRGKLNAAVDSRLRELDEGNSLIEPDEDAPQFSIDRGLRITVDLRGNGSGVVAYRARKDAPPVDLSMVNHYDTERFWDPIYKAPSPQFILEPGAFYILASKQRIRVMPNYAAEMLPYDLATQEFRVHYAGFFDPGFGYGADGEIPGTKAVLEVRATQMPILLEDEQFVGRLHYYKMASTPDIVYGCGIGSSYQQQGLTLSKQFKRADNTGSDAEVKRVSESGVSDEEDDARSVLALQISF